MPISGRGSTSSVDEAIDRAGNLLLRIGLGLMLLILYFLYYLMLHERQGGSLGFGPEIYVYLAGVALLRRSAWGYRQGLRILKFLAVGGPLIVAANVALLLFVTYSKSSDELVHQFRAMLANTATLSYFIAVLLALTVSIVPAWRYWRALRMIDPKEVFRELKFAQRFPKSVIAIVCVYCIASGVGVFLVFRLAAAPPRSHYSSDQLPKPSLYWRSDLEGPEQWKSFVLAFQSSLRSNQVQYVNVRDLDTTEDEVFGPLLPDDYYAFDVTAPDGASPYYAVGLTPYGTNETLLAFALIPEDRRSRVKTHRFLKDLEIKPWEEKMPREFLGGERRICLFEGFSNTVVYIECHSGPNDTAMAQSLLDAFRLHLIEGRP